MLTHLTKVDGLHSLQLWSIVTHLRPQVVQLHLDEGADSNKVNKDGDIPLHLAPTKGHKDMVPWVRGVSTYNKEGED